MEAEKSHIESDRVISGTLPEKTSSIHSIIGAEIYPTVKPL